MPVVPSENKGANGGPIEPGSMYQLGRPNDSVVYYQGKKHYFLPPEKPDGFLIIHDLSKEDYEKAIKDRPVSFSADMIKIRNKGLGAGWITDADGVSHLVEVSLIPGPETPEVTASRWGIDPSGRLSETREPIEYTAPWSPASDADITMKFGTGGIPTSRATRLLYRIRAFFGRLLRL